MMISKSDVIRWNNSYPFDRWWRKKHGVPFGSPSHLQQCPLDIKFEWLEDKLFSEISVPLKYEIGDWLKPLTVLTDDDIYNNIDLSDLEIPTDESD